MAGKTNTWENDTLALVFTNTTPALNINYIGTKLTGSATAGSFYISLHTADPGETGSTAAECAYTSYVRVAVARSSAGWTVSGNTATNFAAVTFPTATGGTETATHFGICTASTGSTLIFYGEFSSGGLSIASGVTPQIPAGNLSVTED